MKMVVNATVKEIELEVKTTKAKIENATQILNRITLEFKTVEEATKFYDLLDTKQPVTITLEV